MTGAVGDTITSQYGNTPAGQQNQSMSDTLAAITGGPAAAALASAANAAQKYASTNTQAPAGNPAGFASSPLQQTADTVGGAGGMVTPGGMTGAVSNDISGQSNALSNVMGAFNFDQPRTLDAYKTMIGALTTLAGNEESMKEKQLELSQSAKQVVSGPDGFYVVDVNNPQNATKIINKPGKWSTKAEATHYAFGVIPQEGATIHTYTPPDGSAPSDYRDGDSVTMFDPSSPTDQRTVTVGKSDWTIAVNAGWQVL